MATLSELQSRARTASTRIDTATRIIDNLLINTSAGATSADIRGQVLLAENLLNRQEQELTDIQTEIPGVTDSTAGDAQTLQTYCQQLLVTITELRVRLNNAQDVARSNDNTQASATNASTNSSADIVQQEKNVASEGARTQNPPVEKTVITPDNETVSTQRARTVSTNARVPTVRDNSNLGVQSGTSTVGGNQNTRSGRIIQGSPSSTAPSDDQSTPTRDTVGVSSGSDDRPPIAPDFLNRITPTGNKLAGLASQTYTISIYMMDADDYQSLIVNNRKIIPGRQGGKPPSLIIQSGGIPFNDDRNPWFLEDFYIENLYIQSVVGTQAQGSPHNAVDMKFTILEPQGITFLNRLNNAVKQYTGLSNATTNELSQNYLMVIRFYGYDDSGNLVSGADLGVNEIGSDPRSIVEKFIPFQIADVNYRIGTKAVEYDVTATIPSTNIGFSQARATIPFNMQLTATNVQTLLNGSAQFTSGNAGSNIATLSQGLCEALNQHQLQLQKEGGYTWPDIYEIELEESIRKAKMKKPGTQNKKRANMNTSVDPNQRLRTDTSRYDAETKTWNITAGTQIVQLIDLVMRNSDYITSQQTIEFDEVTGEVYNNTPVATVQWYRIRSQVTPYQYDEKRRDYAYKIKYTVSRYQINTPRSAYFPPAAYRGVHKLYNYWFTGENTEVLDFEINVNANYLTTIGNDARTDNTASGRWFEKRVYQSRSTESSQGGEKESTLPSASLSSRLYTIADVAKAELEIVGDPDWIQQSEVFYTKDITLTPFLTDGSVNYDGSEVLYEVRFNPVNDYDIDTGLTPVYQNNVKESSATGEKNLPQESIVWAAAVVHNYFNEGKFTQKLVGTIRDFSAAVNTITQNGTSAQNAATSSQDTRGDIANTEQVAVPLPGANTPTATSVASSSSLDVAGGTQGNGFDPDSIIVSP